MKRFSIIITTLLLCGVARAQQQISLTLSDDDVQAVIQRLDRSGILNNADATSDLLVRLRQQLRSVYDPTPVAIVSATKTAANEEVLVIAGDETADLQGSFVAVGSRIYPVIAAAYVTATDRTRILLPVNAGVVATNPAALIYRHLRFQPPTTQAAATRPAP